MSKIEYTEIDKFIYENEIKPYMPKRIFDAHTHIQIPRFYPDLDSYPLTMDPEFHEVDLAKLKFWWKNLFPDSVTSGLVLGMPSKQCDIIGVNRNMGETLREKDLRFSILTGPQLSDDQLESQVKELKPHGLKPYMCFSKLQNVNDSGICDLIPESQIAIADKYKLSITLHVAKPRGMADADNLSEINRLVKKYPNCNFILAHCGRCFITPNAEEMLKKLTVASNLWIDTSAVCDTGVFLYLLSRYEKSQILFGTDLVMASGFKGSYVRLGMSWEWLNKGGIERAGGQTIKATFAAYENLCAMFHAGKFCKVSESDWNNIFYNNAERLFKLAK